MPRVESSVLSSQSRVMRALVAAGLSLSLLTVFLVPPAGLPLPSCFFQSITGHSCLTCGLTRSLHAFSHGDVAAAFRFHFFGPFVLAAALFCLTITCREAIGGTRSGLWASARSNLRAFMIVAVVWLLYWAYRLVAESHVIP